MSTKLIIVKVPIEWLTDQTHLLNPINDFIDKMKLIGHEAFILPECEMEIIDIENCETKEQYLEKLSMKAKVFHIHVGNLPSSKITKYLDKIKTELQNTPFGKNAIYFIKDQNGRTSDLQIIDI